MYICIKSIRVGINWKKLQLIFSNLLAVVNKKSASSFQKRKGLQIASFVFPFYVKLILTLSDKLVL